MPFVAYLPTISLFLFFIRIKLSPTTLRPHTVPRIFPSRLLSPMLLMTCSLMWTSPSQGSGSQRLGSVPGLGNGTSNARRRRPTKPYTRHPPYHPLMSVSFPSGIGTVSRFAALTHVDTTQSSSTIPPHHYTHSSEVSSQAHRALSNARPSNLPLTMRSTQITPLPFVPLQETTPPAPIATLLGRCPMSSSTATHSGKLGASSSTPSIIIPPTTSSRRRMAAAASSNSSMPPKPYFAPCPRAPQTHLGPEPGRSVPRRLLFFFPRSAFLGFSEETGCRVTEVFAPLSQHYL
jgi:hypothetical protein